jgi:hypothetical protein
MKSILAALWIIPLLPSCLSHQQATFTPSTSPPPRTYAALVRLQESPILEPLARIYTRQYELSATVSPNQDLSQYYLEREFPSGFKCRARWVPTRLRVRRTTNEVLCRRNNEPWISFGYLNDRIIAIEVAGPELILVRDQSGLTSFTYNKRFQVKPVSQWYNMAYHTEVSLTSDTILTIVRNVQFPQGECIREIYQRKLNESNRFQMVSITGVLHYYKSKSNLCILTVAQEIYCRMVPDFDQWTLVRFALPEIMVDYFVTSIYVQSDLTLHVTAIHRVTFQDFRLMSLNWKSLPLRELQILQKRKHH